MNIHDPKFLYKNVNIHSIHNSHMKILHMSINYEILCSSKMGQTTDKLIKMWINLKKIMVNKRSHMLFNLDKVLEQT